uniref:exosortase Y-associated Wzy-like protein n=1 Tax=Pedobacter schmidteae TaxID=2201271 RepID=UPI000EAC4060|nr:hypothetical protein [Pedobacter schmidteae]
MNNRVFNDRYVLLFIPWVLACLFSDYPAFSYLLAWMGSFYIFYISLTGRVKPLSADRDFAGQLMRPIILVQLIFAGYMCCTSIFYFLDVLGYVDFIKADISYLVDEKRLHLTAQCQRYYCLAHASFISGILIYMRPGPSPTYSYRSADFSGLIFRIAVIAATASYLLSFADGFSQFSHQLNTLSFIAGTLALAYAIPEPGIWRTFFCLLIYAINFYHALISGFKEPIILSILILGLFLYPAYKRTVVLIFVPLLLSLFTLLPTYNRIFREQAWSAEVASDQARDLALEGAFNFENDDSNWPFLTYRLSEISMFTKYVQSTPGYTDYYGFDLIQQSIVAVVPRIFWPSKPLTEQLVMERVYEAGVVSRNSQVSAKPAFVVDAYLSGGAFGIFICLFSYGALCQLIANKAEELFGGYMLGITLIFTGLFQVFWRGQSFEFLLNSVCWSYISMLMIFWILRITHILNPT